jgi:4-hydroxy 2-oxovalerate aldolase
MKAAYGWGTNPYYYLSGKYGIHPTYIQEMLGDPRYGEEDILTVINRLRDEGGKKFSFDTLDGARQFYHGAPGGSWKPADMLAGREVLIIGAGPGVDRHRGALEAYIRDQKPVVLALNTQGGIDPRLIDLRAASHPMRLLADCDDHLALPQPLITPASMLPEDLRIRMVGKELLDFGISFSNSGFSFDHSSCNTPSLLVLAYALAVAGSGRATHILLAGFDGYPEGDARNTEVEAVFSAMQNASGSPDLISVTPTRYKHLIQKSIYGL